MADMTNFGQDSSKIGSRNFLHVNLLKMTHPTLRVKLTMIMAAMMMMPTMPKKSMVTLVLHLSGNE